MRRSLGVLTVAAALCAATALDCLGRNDLRGRRPGLGPRRRHEPVRRVRGRARRLEPRAHPAALLPRHAARDPAQPHGPGARRGGPGPPGRRLVQAVPARRAQQGTDPEEGRPDADPAGVVRRLGGEVRFDPGASPLRVLGQAYRGSLSVYVERGKLFAVNELSLDHYLRGVVPREMPFYWPQEALRAQAVVARPTRSRRCTRATASTSTRTSATRCTTASRPSGLRRTRPSHPQQDGS